MISNASILVDSPDTELRSVLVTSIKHALEDAGFSDVACVPTDGPEDRLYPREKMPSILDSLREARPQLFDSAIEIGYGTLGLVPGDATGAETPEEMLDDVEA